MEWRCGAGRTYKASRKMNLTNIPFWALCAMPAAILSSHPLAMHAALGVLEPALQPSAAEGGPIQFIHIPKNGGTSIESYGSTIGQEWAGTRHDWPDGPTPLCAYNFPFGGENPGASNGGSAWHVPPRVWMENGAQPYGGETFCVVRNPYTRLVSEFIHEQRAERAGLGAPCGEEGLNAWVHDVLDKQALRDISDGEPLPPEAGDWDCHLLPAWVYTSDCDHVLRFETLEADFAQLMAEKAGVSGAKLPDSNAASCTLLASALDDRARELVRAVYAKDFEQFGYSIVVPEAAFGFLDRAEVAEIDRELARRRAARADANQNRVPGELSEALI
jgi:hypothetical protein